MNSFGAILKKERESKGISLQEISARTKIGVRLLKALEDEQFDQLPGGIFDKSFLRQYARALNLDEDNIVSEYLRAVGVPPEPQPIAAPTGPEPKFVPFSNEDEPQGGGYVRLILTAVLLGAVVAGGFYGI
jgi:cytoskeleton protein RodZ